MGLKTPPPVVFVEFMGGFGLWLRLDMDRNLKIWTPTQIIFEQTAVHFVFFSFCSQ